jgi:ribosomal protein S18 acetylase RimI-like enzyme
MTPTTPKGRAAQSCIIRDASLREMVNLAQEISILEAPGQWNSAAYKQHLSHSDIHLVAEYDGRIVGSVTAATNGMLGKEIPVLDFVKVLRAYRRSGIGRQLVTEAVTRLVAAGKSPIACAVITPESNSFVQSLPKEIKAHLQVDTRLLAARKGIQRAS